MAKKYPVQLKQFGARIKLLREDDEITQERLAEISGIGIRTVQRIEAGQYAVNLRTVFALCEALGARIDDALSVDQPWLRKPRH